MMIARIGPRRGIFWIVLIWGLLSAANAFVWSPASFYVVRFFLGIAEAGFFPGMVFYSYCVMNFCGNFAGSCAHMPDIAAAEPGRSRKPLCGGVGDDVAASAAAPRGR